MNFEFVHKKVKNFQEESGIQFNNVNLLIIALTHPSAIRVLDHHRNQSNQRLEFLGDAVVGLVIGEFFYSYSSYWDEGTLTARRALVINGKALSEAAEKIKLHQNIIMSPEEYNRKSNLKQSNLADAFEALTGAIYLDKGLDFTTQFVISSLEDQIYRALMSKNIKDDKSTLQELTQSMGIGTPVYKLVSKNGPAHNPTFKISAIINGIELGLGNGSRKIDAERNAAKLAYKSLETNKKLAFGSKAKFKTKLKYFIKDFYDSISSSD